MVSRSDLLCKEWVNAVSIFLSLSSSCLTAFTSKDLEDISYKEQIQFKCLPNKGYFNTNSRPQRISFPSIKRSGINPRDVPGDIKLFFGH